MIIFALTKDSKNRTGLFGSLQSLFRLGSFRGFTGQHYYTPTDRTMQNDGEDNME